MRRRYLPLAAVLGAAVAIVPALAGAAPTEAKLEVNENCVQAAWPCWTTEGSASTAKPTKSVTIASGGTITFIDHVSTAAAVVWMGSAPTCTGVPTSAMAGWEGKCTFATSGTYKFESSTLFKESGYTPIDYTKYEIVVEGSTTPTTTGTTGTTTTTTTTTPPPSPESPLAGSESQAVKVAKSQHGGSVKGSINLSKAAAGDRLEVDLLTQSASLAKAKHSARVRVGRYVRSSLSAGKLSFSVKPNAKARRAIRRRHRLALTVEIVLTPASGEALTITRSVTVHG
jgi:hypothetical protein